MGLSVAAYYLYLNNKEKVDDFLRKQGINMPLSPGAKDYSGMSLEELVGTKGQIEDLIAEMEHKMKEQVKG